MVSSFAPGHTARKLLGTECEIRDLADSSAGLSRLNCLFYPVRMGRERGLEERCWGISVSRNPSGFMD